MPVGQFQFVNKEKRIERKKRVRELLCRVSQSSENVISNGDHILLSEKPQHHIRVGDDDEVACNLNIFCLICFKFKLIEKLF